MLTGLVQNHHPTREHANTVDTLKAVKRGTTHLRNASEFTNDPADAGADAMPRTPSSLHASTPKKLICQSVPHTGILFEIV